MTKSNIKDIIELINNGWRAYSSTPDASVYAQLGCPYAPEKNEEGKKVRKRNKPFWFVRADSFLCVGCSQRCALFRPEGFVPPLPINYEERPNNPYLLTPVEMVQRKSLLRVDEVAYCLNIRERTVYDWVAEGRLRKAEGQPLRIPAEDVAYEMTNFED